MNRALLTKLPIGIGRHLSNYPARVPLSKLAGGSLSRDRIEPGARPRTNWLPHATATAGLAPGYLGLIRRRYAVYDLD